MHLRLGACARAVGAAILLLTALPAWGKVEQFAVPGIGKTALLFRAASLRAGELPPRIVVRNAPHVFSSQLNLACLGIPLQPQDLLVYFPESQKCELVHDRSSAGKPGERRLAGLSERSLSWPVIAKELESRSVLVLQPEVQMPAVAGLCICPDLGPLIFIDGFEGN